MSPATISDLTTYENKTMRELEYVEKNILLKSNLSLRQVTERNVKQLLLLNKPRVAQIWKEFFQTVQTLKLKIEIFQDAEQLQMN